MASTSAPRSGRSNVGGVGVGNKSTGGSNMDTLKNLFKIGHFITNCDSLSELGKIEHDDVAVKGQMRKLLEKTSEKISSMREQLKQVHGEKQALEKRLRELETAGVKKNEEIHRLQGKLECEQGEKLEAKESIDALMKALQNVCKNLDTHLEGELTELFPNGGKSSKEDVSNVKSALNMISSRILGNLQHWKDSQIAVQEEVKKWKEALLGELVEKFKPDLSTVLPNKSFDPPKEGSSVGPSVPKKVRSSSELVPEKIIVKHEPHDSEEDDAQGNESELEEVDDFLEFFNP